MQTGHGETWTVKQPSKVSASQAGSPTQLDHSVLKSLDIHVILLLGPGKHVTLGKAILCS